MTDTAARFAVYELRRCRIPKCGTLMTDEIAIAEFATHADARRHVETLRKSTPQTTLPDRRPKSLIIYAGGHKICHLHTLGNRRTHRIFI